MAHTADKTSSPPAGLLRTEHIALIDGGVSAIVASRNATHHPSVMRAVGTAINGDGTQVTVYLNRPSSVQLLSDLENQGPIAVVFSSPSTHHTVQLKAHRIEHLRPARSSDAPVLQRYLQAMEGELNQIGFPPACTRIMLAHELQDVVAVTFRPELAYDQTPGALAGMPLARHEGQA